MADEGSQDGRRYKLYVSRAQDLYVLFYPNELIVVGLLGSHPALCQSADVAAVHFADGLAVAPSAQVVQNNAPRSRAASSSDQPAGEQPRLGSKKMARQRKKKQPLGDRAPLCRLVLDDGSAYDIAPSFASGAAFVEANHRLVEQPRLLRSIYASTDMYHDCAGYLAIMAARSPELSFADSFALERIDPDDPRLLDILIGQAGSQSKRQRHD